MILEVSDDRVAQLVAPGTLPNDFQLISPMLRELIYSSDVSENITVENEKNDPSIVAYACLFLH